MVDGKDTLINPRIDVLLIKVLRFMCFIIGQAGWKIEWVNNVIDLLLFISIRSYFANPSSFLALFLLILYPKSFLTFSLDLVFRLIISFICETLSLIDISYSSLLILIKTDCICSSTRYTQFVSFSTELRGQGDLFDVLSMFRNVG